MLLSGIVTLRVTCTYTSLYRFLSLPGFRFLSYTSDLLMYTATFSCYTTPLTVSLQLSILLTHHLHPGDYHLSLLPSFLFLFRALL